MSSVLLQKFLIPLLALFVATFCVAAQERYALLIGIGRYPDNSGWSSIHGDNDVVIINQLLLKQGFKKENVRTVTNSSATKAGILTALDELRNCVADDDVVYIHFSGHGQQVTDLDGDETDHYDEAWIPYDALNRFIQGVYEGQNHILDDEINLYLNGLRAKVGPKGKIVLVADACHSGSGSRGLSVDEEFIRGSSAPFIIPDSRSNVIKKESPVLWLYVGACKPYQTNYEHKSSDGVYYGSLSYVIAGTDADMGSSDYRDILKTWNTALITITRYPQDLDHEGRPGKSNNLMF